MKPARHAGRTPLPRNLVEIDLEPRAGSLRAEVLAGLSRSPKSLPPKLFYDARGAALFTRICATAAYYPARTETSIYRDAGVDIARQVGPGATIVEPGAGEMRKIRLLLPALRPAAYVPIDISAQQLREEAQLLAREYPALSVVAVAGDFQDPHLDAVIAAQPGPRVLFFPGSTIGNFEPPQALAFLRRARALLGGGGGVLLGVDLEKDAAILDLAYNDPEGVTAQFNLNLLARLNRELAARFDLSAFRHRAFYDASVHRIEMHLVSTRQQAVPVAGRLIAFAEGETIHTENSYKYTPAQVQALARDAGYARCRTWTDPAGWFGVFLLACD
jgi:dimethylhistidine N-methyltransferase